MKKQQYLIKATGIISGETAASWIEADYMKALEMYADYVKSYSVKGDKSIVVSLSLRHESSEYVFYDVLNACIC